MGALEKWRDFREKVLAACLTQPGTAATNSSRGCRPTRKGWRLRSLPSVRC